MNSVQSSSKFTLTIPPGLVNQYEVLEKVAETINPTENPHEFTFIEMVANIGLLKKATKKPVGRNTQVAAPTGQKFILRVNYTANVLKRVNNDRTKLKLAYFDGTKWVPYSATTKDDSGWTVELSKFIDPPTSWGQ